MEALARLTLFFGPFTDFLATSVLFGAERALEAPEQEVLLRQAAETLYHLWDRGLLERTAFPLGPRVEETLYLYAVYPALAPFARARLGPEARVQAEEGFFRAMRQLGSRAYSEFEKGGMETLLARLALSDLRRAARMRADREGSLLRFHTGGLLQVFGDMEGAMGLYRESLAIKESLGDLQGKGATLHAMARILRVRGDLEGAMGLYRESQAVWESLGDPRGKGATLAMMGQVLLARGEVREGVQALRRALEILVGMGARADAEQVAGIVAEGRRMLGEMFDVLWAEAGGSPFLGLWPEDGLRRLFSLRRP